MTQSNPTHAPFQPVTPDQALKRLKEGNRRFADNVVSIDNLQKQASREELARRPQRPFAIILACSDSRAPAELIFDQGLGDLFVIRVAGNITAPSIVGSVEFAASAFGTQLVVVMGHSGCGAVTATLKAIQDGRGSGSANIQDIIERIRPHVEPIVSSGKPGVSGDLMERAVRANIMASADHLRHGSRLLESLAAKGELRVVTAEYSLETGTVAFFGEGN